MKRAVVVLLLLIANAVVSTSKMAPPDSGFRKSLEHLGFFRSATGKPSPSPARQPRAIEPRRETDPRVARASILPPPRPRGVDGCIAL